VRRVQEDEGLTGAAVLYSVGYGLQLRPNLGA
jgi:hypothetical protein